jgi:hypothetical protein
MLLIASGASIVGRKKPTIAIAIAQFSQVGRASDDVVVGIIRICAKAVP